MPGTYKTEAIVLRSIRYGEADRVLHLYSATRGRIGAIAKGARRPRSRFTGTLEPLTEARVAYFEKERRELVGINYAEAVRSPLSLFGPAEAGPHDHGQAGEAPRQDALGYVSYFAELLDEWAQDADADERIYRLGASMLEALSANAPVEPLARYFEYWLLRLQGVYPESQTKLSTGALAFLAASRSVAPYRVGEVPAELGVLRELENAHRALITMHLEKTLKSDRVLRDLRRHEPTPPTA